MDTTGTTPLPVKQAQYGPASEDDLQQRMQKRMSYILRDITKKYIDKEDLPKNISKERSWMKLVDLFQDPVVSCILKA